MTRKDRQTGEGSKRSVTAGRIVKAVLGRLLLYGALSAGLFAAFTSLYLQSFDFELLLAGVIRNGLEEAIGRPVTMRSLRFDILGGKLLINDVVIASGDPDLPAPLHIEHLLLDVDYSRILKGELELKRVVVLGPAVEIVFAGDGRSNLPELPRQQPPGGMQVHLERLDVYNGTLIVSGQAVGWGMDSGLIDVSLRRADTGFRGGVRLRRLRLVLPELKPFKADLEAGFATDGDRVAGTALLREDNGSTLRLDRWTYDSATGGLETDFRIEADIGLVNRPDLGEIDGRLEGSGKLSYTDGVLGFDAESWVPWVQVGQLRAEGLHNRITLAEGTLKSELLEGQALGGGFSGNVEVHNIFSEPFVQAGLTAKKVDLPALLKAVGLGQVRLSGSLDGTFELTLDTAHTEEMILRGNIATAWRPGAEGPYRRAVEAVRLGRDLQVLGNTVIPIAASGGIEYSEGVLHLADNFIARSPLSEMGVNGSLSADGLDLVLRSRSVGSDEVALALTNLSRLLGIDQGPPETQFPIASIVRQFESKGQAVLRINGPLDKFALDLRVRTDAVRYQGRDFGAGTMRMTWADGVLTFPQIHLRDGASVLDIDGRVEFPQGREVVSEFNIAATAFKLAGLERVAGMEPIGLGGVADGKLKLKIGSEIEGSGEIRARPLELGDLEFDRAQAEIEFGRRLVLRQLEATGPNGVQLQGNIEFDTLNQDWRAAVTARGVRLDRYTRLFAPDLEVSGLAELRIDAGGHKLAASGLLEFSIAGAGVAGIAFGDVQGSLRADGRRAALVVSAGDMSYRVEAELIGDEQREVRLKLENETVDFTPLVREFVPDQRFYLQVLNGISGRVLLTDAGLEAELTLGRVQAGVEQFSASSLGAVNIRYAGEHIYFNDVRIEQSEYQLTMSGSLGLTGDNSISLDLDGGVNLLSLSDFLTDFSFSGGAELKMSVRGTLARPLVYGDVQVVDGFVRHKESNLALANVGGELRIENERVEVSRVTAQFSKGVVGLDGFVNVDWSTLQPTSFQFNIEGTGVDFDIPQELQATLDASLILRGSLEDSVLTGAVDVREALYTKRFEPEAELLRAQQQPLPVAADELRKIRLDLALQGDENIRVDNNFADMEVILDLRILGSAAEPVFTGRAEVKEGEVYYRDRKYTVTSGVIDFVNPYRLEPHFDFRAETQIKEYRVFLEFHGTPDRLFPTLSSDPAESTIDILHLLAVGKVRDNPFPSDTERLQEQLLGLALSGFITRQVTGQLERRAERLFGIDRFRIDPFFPGGSNNLSPRVTVGEQISDQLSVIYSRNLSANAEQVLVFEYELSPTMVLIGSREEDGSYAIDMHLKHRFR
jgi:autotransporter translocation and assembly factor TamB